MHKYLMPFAVLALAGSILFAATPRAEADAPRTAACEFIQAQGANKLADKTRAWMDAQLAAGKGSFAFTGQMVCAW